MEDLKPGDRVSFLVVLPNGQATTGSGVVSRYTITGQPLIHPSIPLPSGARMANIQKSKS